MTKLQEKILQDDVNNINENLQTLTTNCDGADELNDIINNNVDIDYRQLYAKKGTLQTLLHNIYGLYNPLEAHINTLRTFVKNYLDLLYHAYILKEYEMDKFYHSKANCEATQQRSIIGEKSAQYWSDLKELYDQFTYVHTHKVTLEEAIEDSERDQAANRLGRERGRKYPYCDCSILIHDLLPESKR